VRTKGQRRKQLRLVPLAVLIHVCHQIREEYIKIHRRNASIEIDFWELPAYFDTYHEDGNPLNIAPYQIRVSLGPINNTPQSGWNCSGKSNTQRSLGRPVDLLPLLRLSARYPAMKYSFVPARREGDRSGREQHLTIAKECRDLNGLVEHNDKTWLHNLRDGVIKKVIVNQVGYGSAYLITVWASIRRADALIVGQTHALQLFGEDLGSVGVPSTEYFVMECWTYLGS
jgi:hypothetical protein